MDLAICEIRAEGVTEPAEDGIEEEDRRQVDQAEVGKSRDQAAGRAEALGIPR